jgi:hypothetical protein
VPRIGCATDSQKSFGAQLRELFQRARDLSTRGLPPEQYREKWAFRPTTKWSPRTIRSQPGHVGYHAGAAGLDPAVVGSEGLGCGVGLDGATDTQPRGPGAKPRGPSAQMLAGAFSRHRSKFLRSPASAAPAAG